MSFSTIMEISLFALLLLAVVLLHVRLSLQLKLWELDSKRLRCVSDDVVINASQIYKEAIESRNKFAEIGDESIQVEVSMDALRKEIGAQKIRLDSIIP